MSFVCCRLSFMSAALLLVAGCGGGPGSGGTTGGGGQSGTPTTVTFTFQGATPTAVAASIGSGAYTAETLSGNTLTLSIPSGTTKFAVAYVCPVYGTALQFTSETIFEATTKDGTSFSEPCIPPPASGVQEGIFWGLLDVSAIPNASTSNLVVQAGAYWNGGTPVQLPETYFVFEVPPGSYRMMAGLMNSSSPSEPNILIAAKDLGTQTVPGSLNGGNAVVLGTADETTLEAITYNNVPSGFSSPVTTANLMFAEGGEMSIATGATNQYGALPAAATENGDSYFFTASSANSVLPQQGVEAFQSSSTAGPVTFNFPAPWSYAGPAAAALPTFDVNYSGFAGKSGVYDLAALWWGYTSPALSNINILATENYQNGSTMLAVPDLSGLSGFLAAPSSGTEVGWEAIIAQSSAPMSLTVPFKASGSMVSNEGFYLEP